VISSERLEYTRSGSNSADEVKETYNNNKRGNSGGSTYRSYSLVNNLDGRISCV
jgi:hypothetical protein